MSAIIVGWDAPASIATECDAAAAQSRSLGFEPAIVWVPHPIQDRTDEELHAIADDALDGILAAVTARA